jgi:alkylation response protein AidB-like acyl-CoA dehydrogenase
MPMFSLHLTSEQIEIRDTVRDFARTEVKPAAEKPQRMEAVDRSPMTDVLSQASELGLRTLALSEALGGAGADVLTSCIVAEELSFGDPGTATILAETSKLAQVLFDRLMTVEQRDRLLPGFLGDGQCQLAWASGRADQEIGINYHRPASTTRATVTARRSGSDYVLDGTARWVANAPLAGLMAVSALVDASAPGRSGMATLLVPRGAKGVAVEAHATGRFHGSSGDIEFTGCRTSAANLLGTPAEGAAVFGALMRCRDAPTDVAINLGIGVAAYAAAVDYAKLRVQGGRPIIEHQAIAEKLAEAAIRIEAARTLIRTAAWAYDHPEAVADRSLPDGPIAGMARVFTAEAVYRLAKDCAECFGAMGVMRDIPAHLHIRNARICLHSGSGVTDAKLGIAEALAGFERNPATA